MTKKWYEELYEDFESYDEEPYTQNTVVEVDFIEREIGSDRSLQILDVGCGNGRHCLEMARRGYEVVGVDLSESMLAQGRRQAEVEAIDVKLLQVDARNLGMRNEYDIAVMLCEGGFSLVEEDDMDRQILVNVFHALRPSGKLIMTAPHAVFMLTHQDGDTFDEVTFREDFTLEIDGAKGKKKTLDCTQRYYTCPELKWMLKETGFHTVEFFACTEAGFTRDLKPGKKHFELGVIAEKPDRA